MSLRHILVGTAIAALSVACGGGKKASAPAAPAAQAPAKAAKAAPAKAAPAKAAPAKAAPAGKGTIKGAVAFTGAAVASKKLDTSADPACKAAVNDESVLVNANKTLKNVVVRVTGLDAKAAGGEDITLTQKGCRYAPRVQTIVAGKKVIIKNGDETLHNVHTYRGSKTGFNEAQPAGAPDKKKKMKAAKAGEPEMVKFKCDAHPWMSAFIMVTSHGHAAVTGDDGSFELKDVPAGKYSLEAWHESFGSKKAEVEVKADGTAEVKFSYDGTEKAG